MIGLGALLLAAGCGSGNEDFDTANLLQRTVRAGQAAEMVLTGGGSLNLPADTFAADTIVIFSNYFGGGDLAFINYPTPTHASEDLLGSLVINTPVDAVYGSNITVQFPLKAAAAAAVSAASAGQKYSVYRFDFDHGIWNQWGATFATVDAGADTATAVLPTTGFTGFIGSIAIFNGLLAPDNPLQTTITGTVKDGTGSGLATDVGLFLNIGGVLHPVALANGRIPAVTYGDGQAATLANTVDSAASGSFTMILPDNLIGQNVTLEFGREDEGHQTQSRFDILAPASPLAAAQFITVRYGENNVASQPVL